MIISLHTLLFASALLILLLSQHKRLKNLHYLAFVPIIIDANVSQWHLIDDTARISIDLLMIAVFAYIYQMFDNKIIKLAYIPLSIYLFITIHSTPLFKNSLSIPKIKLPRLSQDAELLISFKNQTAALDWINQNNTIYEVKYPAFTPEDLSFNLDEYALVNLSQNQESSIKSIIKDFEKDELITHVEMNEVLELKPLEGTSTTANNTYTDDPQSSKQWSGEKLELDKYYDLIADNAKLNSQSFIAILDTGVESNHEDLKENYFSINSLGDNDPRGHGTHCAGIAAAVTGNGIGIASLLPKGSSMKVAGIKVLNAFGMGTQDQIIRGIIEAADKGASVISMSLGGLSNDEKRTAYNEAVAYANSKGSIVVVSAGNSNKNAKDFSPANTEGVITVGSIDSKLKKSSFSNTLEDIEMGIYAPGTNIYSTYKSNSYSYQSGTSMSAPFVSGMVGVLKMLRPQLNTKQVYTILKKSAQKKNGLLIIDPYHAVKYTLDNY